MITSIVVLCFKGCSLVSTTSSFFSTWTTTFFLVDLLNKISNNLRFIALHITWVRSKPDAPTIPPILTNKASLIAKPAIAAATPLRLFNNDIVIGMSAPPTRILKNQPNKLENIDNPIIKIINSIPELIKINAIIEPNVNNNELNV